MFSRGILVALKHPRESILPIEHYDAKRAWTFLEDEHDKVLTEWGNYLERRKQGQGPELFATAEAAKIWLVQQAPVKFVDGAWLAHTHTRSPLSLPSGASPKLPGRSCRKSSVMAICTTFISTAKFWKISGAPFQMATAPTSSNRASGM
ncbi:hypothetical protein ABVK25_011495 [Lepraria finkii]|uniref:Uncharacterized protein n=1 Tax=Lepraria finkii TaxID=1340010 RepID=A0ABR4AVF0_9LECA